MPRITSVSGSVEADGENTIVLHFEDGGWEVLGVKTLTFAQIKAMTLNPGAAREILHLN